MWTIQLHPSRLNKRRTHDCKHHGTTSLVAALDVKTGAVIGRLVARRKAAVFRHFLDGAEMNAPMDHYIDAAMDNAFDHKAKFIFGWFAKRPRRGSKGGGDRVGGAA